MSDQMTGALVGVLGALAGVLLASWLTRRHEHRRWLLDKRLDAYTELLKAWQQLMNERIRNNMDERLDQHAAFTVPVLVCLLIADRPVKARVEELETLLNRYVETGRLGKHPAAEALGRLHNEMRTELLGVRVRPRWVQRLGAKSRARRLLKQYGPPPQ